MHYLQYPNIGDDQVQYTTPWKTVFSNASGFVQQNNVCRHTVHKRLEEHKKELKMLTWSTNSPGLNLIKCLWDVLDKQGRSMEAPPYSL